ncbi:MAG: rRNA maturation RNase YbeY [Candidatus Omnitrophica bacterium]|nr:rRNA maturation RNase YbeY [Candidatus Omnitrophota bacterium]
MRVSVENLDKKNKLPIQRRIVRSAVIYLLRLLKIKQAQVNLYFITNQRIKMLNRLYLKRDYPTDVLAFNLNNSKKNILAEVFISLKTVRENARFYKNSYPLEILLCIVHALLHILGFKDNTEKNKKVILKKQESLLEKLSSYLYKKYKLII